MARLLRIYLQGCSYHIVQRVNNREPCLYSDQDYATYLTFPHQGVRVLGFRLFTD